MVKKYDHYVVGYYGMRNSGDDALMCASDIGINLLTQHNRSLIHSEYALDFPIQASLAVSPKFQLKGLKRLSQYHKAMLSQHVIFGGGSVLHSFRDIQFKRHLLKLSGGEHSRCVGVGIEPFTCKQSEMECAKLLNSLPFVGVRDKTSYDIATSISPNANIELTFDLAPTLLQHKAHINVKTERTGIAFNFCPRALDAFNTFDSENEKKRLQKAKTLIQSVATFSNEPIYLVDFNGNPRSGDSLIHDQIESSLKSTVDIIRIPYHPNPYKLLGLLSGVRVMVGMRLHAMIFSFMMKTPCISLNYHKKCWEWCRQIGTPSQYQFCSEDFVEKALISEIQSGIGTAFANSSLSVEKAQQAALRNWRTL